MWRSAEQQKIQNTTKPPDIGAWRNGAPARIDLLGRHESGRPRQQRAARTQFCLAHRQAEIAHANSAALVEQQIARLQIAMNDSLSMCEIDRASCLSQPTSGLVNGDGPLPTQP